jgi:MFS family permease
MLAPVPRTVTEKNAGSQANNAAESLRNWLPSTLVFAVVLLVMFWRLGSYPPYFNDMVDQGIHMEVNKVFDHADISNKVNWYWKDMHSSAAYESPLYGMVIELGLRLFGLTLFGVRFFPALIEFGALILTFFAFRKYFPQYLLLSFILLMALSPWHLLIARSGGIQAFSISLYLIALSTLVLLINRKRSVGLAILAGISTAVIPYGYAGIRLVLPLLVLLAIVCFRRIEKYNLFAYLGTILAICAIQIGDFPRSLQMYFYARGENLISVARKLPNGGYDLAFIAHKLNENFNLLFRMIMGLNEKAFWNVNVASNLAAIKYAVLYPKFLVPLFIVGLVYSLAHAYKQKRFILAMPVLLLIVGLVPNMMSGFGIPDLLRSITLLVPIYFLITYGAYSLFCSIYTISSDKLRIVFWGLFVMFVGLASVYQVNNYFHYEKDAIHGGKNDAAMVMYDQFLEPYMVSHPNNRILYHEFGPFNEWSYVVVRWLGGKRVQTMRDERKLVFLTNDNRASMDRLLKQGYFDIVVSSWPDQLEHMLRDTKAMEAQVCPPGYKIYYVKR